MEITHSIYSKLLLVKLWLIKLLNEILTIAQVKYQEPLFNFFLLGI